MNFCVVGVTRNPGHFSHMIAYQKLGKALGYDSYVLTFADNVSFFPSDVPIVHYEKKNNTKVDVALIYTPALENLKIVRNYKKKYKTSIIYVFHEPISSFSAYSKNGFSFWKVTRLRFINYINSLITRSVDAVLLGSQAAIDNYDASSLYRNKNRILFPLIFDDENFSRDKEYFSYIGHITPDHAYSEFLSFIKQAANDSDFKDTNFLIASRNEVDIDDVMSEMKAKGRLIIQSGRPLSNEEINEYYAKSRAIWNAYTRTTQSGVLVKSFMFGCPAILIADNLSDSTIPGKNVECVSDNKDYNQLKNALLKITHQNKYYSENARETFLKHFFYMSNKELFKQILDGIEPPKR